MTASRSNGRNAIEEIRAASRAMKEAVERAQSV